MVLSKDAAMNKFGFDIDLFFNSDVFKTAVPRFLKTVKASLAQDVPQKIKAAEDAGANPLEFKRYVRAIEDSFSVLNSSNAGASFNLGNSSDGESKIYRANKSYDLDHFNKRAEEEKAKKRNEFLAWMAARNKKIADQKKAETMPVGGEEN